MNKKIIIIITTVVFLSFVVDLVLSMAKIQTILWLSGIAFLSIVTYLPRSKMLFTFVFSVLTGLLLGINLGIVALCYFFLQLVIGAVPNRILSYLLESLGFFSLFAVLSTMTLPIDFILVNALLTFLLMLLLSNRVSPNYSSYSL